MRRCLDAHWEADILDNFLIANEFDTRIRDVGSSLFAAITHLLETLFLCDLVSRATAPITILQRYALRFGFAPSFKL
jgi:hypothetical protein